ncbi:MAG: ribosome assembly cofactor RimP [Bacteroidales bacterium]|nr:ribosome assembly cofactor RimP [Bacteroidales bacterium]
MLNKSDIDKLATGCINEKSFIVDLTVNNANQIKVYIDSFEGISIEECVRISRCIEGQLDREKEDFSLEVSSAGLTLPFKVPQQYKKHMGKDVEVITHEGIKHKGKLQSFDGKNIELELIKGKKKAKKNVPENEDLVKKIALEDIKSTTLIINF